MDLKTFENICAMIEKEVCRNDIGELCEYWDVTENDYHEFMKLAKSGFDAQKEREVE